MLQKASVTIDSHAKMPMYSPECFGLALHLHFTFMDLADAFTQSDVHCIMLHIYF